MTRNKTVPRPVVLKRRQRIVRPSLAFTSSVLTTGPTEVVWIRRVMRMVVPSNTTIATKAKRRSTHVGQITVGVMHPLQSTIRIVAQVQAACKT